MIEDNVERQVTFVAAHLAAHEGHFDRRNADFQSLVQNVVFPDESGIFKPHVPLFFLGDLNYRLSVLHPSRSDTNLHTISPEEQAESDLSLITALKGQIMDFLETGKFTNLVPHDQLPLSPLALHLHESPITFQPTYKYESYAPPTYAPTRIPSWTDRILYSPETILTDDYTSTTSKTFSDHQAVSMGAVLQEGDFSEEDGDMPWGINTGWRGRQAFGESLGYLFGAIEVMGETKVGVLMGAMTVAAVTYYMYR
jgi:endonuclease/exonuclease/phosphatase family metal-dependent hydrolase